MRRAGFPVPGLLLAVFALAAQQPEATPVVGWYNGEWQSGIPGLANWYLGPNRFARVYDEFEVPAGGWTVVGVFSDNGLYGFPPVTHAAWEIRRGMRPRHGGKIVAKGVSPATQRPDPSVTPRYPADEAAKHFRIQVGGLRVTLPPGRYWLSVAPVGNGQSYISATRGTNAVGAPLSTALVGKSGGKSFSPAGQQSSKGEAGTGRHFAQGVIAAK